jgi:hypothetical protein
MSQTGANEDEDTGVFVIVRGGGCRRPALPQTWRLAAMRIVL